MKRGFKGFSVFVVVVLLFLAVGCTSLEEVEETKDDLDRASRDEMLYRSEEELDSFVTRGDENVVDWRLAQEFAYLELEEMQMEGYFPKEAELRELPIVVYDHDGDMRYYEFRVIDDNNNPIGAITAVADKTRGYPIAYTLLFPKDYNDSLEKLLDKGKITEDNLLSLVDNDYPDYAIGIMETTRNGVQLGETYDSETGEEKSKDELKEAVAIDEFLEEHPEYEDELSEQLKEAEEFQEELDKLWEEAESRQGQIRESTRADVLDEQKINDYNKVKDNDWSDGDDRRWCGPNSVNFTLGYLAHQDRISYDPMDDDIYDKLEDVLDRQSWGPVWPWKIEDGITEFAPGYEANRTSHNADSVLASMEQDIPGISLRLSRSFSAYEPHYRNVVAHRVTEHGWWIFTYTRERMLIHDENNIDDGRRESYNALYHFGYHQVLENGADVM